MKRFPLLLTFLFLIAISCKKDTSLKGIVFKGKYIGKGCWPVIRVIEPSLSSIGLNAKKAIWPKKNFSYDSLYHNAVRAGSIPDTFTNGKVFYLTVSKVESLPDKITNGNCLRTSYFFDIKNIAFTKTTIKEDAQ